MARLQEIFHYNPIIFKEDSSFTLPDFEERNVDTLVSGATLVHTINAVVHAPLVNVNYPGASCVVLTDVDLLGGVTATGVVRTNVTLRANVADVPSSGLVVTDAELPQISYSREGVVFVTHEVGSGSIEGAFQVSPFEELDQRQGNEQKVRELIAYIRTSSSIPNNTRLANRAEFLLEVTIEDAPDELEQLPESLRNFIAFLQSSPHLKYPDIVVSPRGNIRAQWQDAPNKHFSAEFLTTGQAAFVVFAPHRKGTKRVSGIVPVSELLETVEPQNVLSWASE